MTDVTVPSLRVVVVALDDRIFASVRDGLEETGLTVLRWDTPGGDAPGQPPVEPDVLILQGEGLDVPALLNAGARDGWRTVTLPILVLAPSRIEGQDRRAWLEAGAWGVIALPLDPELFRLHLLNLLKVLGPSEALEPGKAPYARDALLSVTGECLALAHRHQRPLSAAAFSLDWGSRRADQEALAIVHRLALSAAESARGSDLVGVTADGALIVLLPDTDAAGAAMFVERLVARMQEEMRGRGVLGQVLAGHVTADPQTPSTPEAFLRAAGAAPG